ncbi:auxin efflux carrier [Microdochium trichocladiopsis]|uniref:Auxin efflux carrier n=1 Tax=Microdochium trichocladiopsis TaxID=1682393 RepID=A0A9P9BSQ3_9PEZI|nr:auxin efflux carrier [Microdochium trichocladiopsis]KAH7029066.1 auxin efflux carrier [Microdochium trichocladiopsis]
MATSGLAETFLGAIQASVSVLLVISYGGIAAHLGLLDGDNTKAISKACVRMFLPALLITQVGSQLELANARDYGIVLLWAMLCHLLSFLMGVFAHLVLGMPDWTTVALMFNNTTSYPLLLISALQETGILESLLARDESVQEAIGRAEAYFLIFATVSSCLTFAVGPRLIDSEHAPEQAKEDDPPTPEQSLSADAEEPVSERSRLLGPDQYNGDETWNDNRFWPSRRRASDASRHTHRRASLVPKLRWSRLGPRTQWWLLFLGDFVNAPLVGALAGTLVGLTPALHRAFFNETTDGGVLTAWLTASLKTIGGLFVPLPVVVAGVSLYTSLNGAGRHASRLPWLPVVFITLVRFVVWPLVSIGTIYALARETGVLGEDPMLWFTMMLMPTGPPAMKLITLVQVSDASADEEMSIAKLLALSYVISPVLSVAVVGSLRASQACNNS